jgi:hypothetical protein
MRLIERQRAVAAIHVEDGPASLFGTVALITVPAD